MGRRFCAATALTALVRRACEHLSKQSKLYHILETQVNPIDAETVSGLRNSSSAISDAL